jgi:hypothetical protein
MFAPSEIERHLAATRAAAVPVTIRESDGRTWLSRLLHRPAAVAPAKGEAAEAPIVLRPARAEDAVALEQLADLDGRRLPPGTRVVAESRGRLIAAAEVATGAAIADPFTPAAAAVALVRLRAAQLRPLLVDR